VLRLRVSIRNIEIGALRPLLVAQRVIVLHCPGFHQRLIRSESFMT
jgi:hypothetical protein